MPEEAPHAPYSLFSDLLRPNTTHIRPSDSIKKDQGLSFASGIFDFDPVLEGYSSVDSSSTTESLSASSSLDREASLSVEPQAPTTNPLPDLASLLTMFNPAAPDPAATTAPVPSFHPSISIDTDTDTGLNTAAMYELAQSITDAHVPTVLSSSSIDSPIKPKPEPKSSMIDLDFDAVCTSLKDMAASGTPASAMMQFLNLSRHALQRDIPAEVVLQGLIDREATYSHSGGSSRESSSPSLSACSSHSSISFASLESIGPSSGGGGAMRRPRQSLREAASPYAIPSAPLVYQCDQCPLVFDRAYNLKEHLKTHDPRCNKRFPCPLNDCPQASHRRADMHRHIKNVHLKKGLTEAERGTVLAIYPGMANDLPTTTTTEQEILPALTTSSSVQDEIKSE